MLSIGALSFAAPWLLLALTALLVLWRLLRSVPPAPARLDFPAIRLLMGLPQHKETPHRTPWWLLAMRLLLAALVILALAHPVLDPGRVLRTSGPLVLVIDNGWSAGNNWLARKETAAALVDEAARENRAVYITTTARNVSNNADPLRPMSPAEARDRLRSIEPMPWTSDFSRVRTQIETLELNGPANAVWLASGLEDPDDDAGPLEQTLKNLGALRFVHPTPSDQPLVIAASENAHDGVLVRVSRPKGGDARTAALVATDDDERLLDRIAFKFGKGEENVNVPLNMPSEIRNRIARIRIENASHAGAVMLFDERLRRRPVGIVSGDTAQVDQPLIGNAFYLNRALEPFAEVRNGNIEALLERQLSVMILSDIGNLTGTEITRLSTWINSGGVLVRFAGPNLADGSDQLLPVNLRRGGRIFGGVMSWDQPSRLAQFDKTSPFAGLQPSEEVVIRRQVLAQPSPELAAKSWSRLQDGTPLVTGEKRGNGWLVLFHTTANAEWSSLALSGLYVDMLRRLVALSQGIPSKNSTTRPLPPLSALDGLGRLSEPPPTSRPISAGVAARISPGPQTPPGFYGGTQLRRAINLGPYLALKAFDDHALGVEIVTYGPSAQRDLRVWLLVAALGLLLIDFLISLILRGLTPRLSRGATAAICLAVSGVFLGASTTPGWAQSSDQFALEATKETRLAYVLTGNTKIDKTSRAGLAGLGQILARRTSVTPGAPVGLDVERDELAFFPLIYWPMADGQASLSDSACTRINAFMRNGGTILFDTRDQNLSGIGGVGPGTQTLRSLSQRLNIPVLLEIPADHVLTKAFYLLQQFPGRWEDGRLFVQQPDERVNDGVSSVIIGANDFAAAWAIDAAGRPLFPVVPGNARQRELAFRFGVNLVMYALTGNYKADQVHVDEILERLGQ